MVREARFLPPASMSAYGIWTDEPESDLLDDVDPVLVDATDPIVRGIADADWLDELES